MQADATHSANLTIRDNEKEIARLEAKFSAAKRTVDQLNTKLSNSEKEGVRLANSLGFETVSMAQSFIDLADNATPYRELVEAHENARIKLQELKIERDGLRAYMNASERSNSTHHLPSNSAGATQKQLDDLQRRFGDLERRYDQLKDVKERSDVRHAVDYRKMKALKDFLRSDAIQRLEDQLKHDYATISQPERTRRKAEIAAIKERKMAEFDLAEQDGIGGSSNGPLSFNEAHSTPTLSLKDKENQQTPVPETRKRPLSIQPFSLAGSPMPQSNPKLRSTDPPSLNTISTASPRLPLNSYSINTEVPVHQQLSSPAADDGAILVPNSSQTEDDPSQGRFSVLSHPRFFLKPSTVRPTPDLRPPSTQKDCKRVYANSSITVLRSNRHEALITPSASTPKPKARPAAVAPRPASVQLVDERSKSKPRHSDTSINSSTWANDTDERPRKMRRISSPGPVASCISMGEPGASAATPLYVGSGNTPRSRRDRDMSASTGAEFAVKTETSTPVANARASSSKQLADYSAYKGRGRYATDRGGGNTTINAAFAIDPARNGGMDFQYDEVVRGREDRRHMEAGDCECCRDYYAAIGPMPDRLQAPLWRTPPNSPGGSKPCLRNNGASSASAEITSHKQAISRHRHQWARASTPPSYWSIGFPTTQEANDINEKARLMHQEKKRNVREEADRDGGRYKKR
ncbi:hypothetical protein B0H17DRAFT_1109384 [Mycena rosella]|uniref:DNA endonuclease activator Ctp1 C-terminal domain-containing protein n=1 Tax=Mycena rosella TaxID=1033263 RepID=A0AAD7BSQ8_MYCRO|nr:hypothetical protein B0H17DRAFT_1109384 [Mycena rosella]